MTQKEMRSASSNKMTVPVQPDHEQPGQHDASFPNSIQLDKRRLFQGMAHVDSLQRRALVQRANDQLGNRFTQALIRHHVSTGGTVAGAKVQRSEATEGSPSPATTTDSAFDPDDIVDQETGDQIETILENSGFLRPYIQDKLANKPISDSSMFIIHESEIDFDAAFIDLHNHHDKKGTPEFDARLKRIKGFYHRASDTIHLRPSSEKSHGMHEAIHRYAEKQFRGIFHRFVDEGVTQYFADKVQEEAGLSPGDAHGYDPELKLARDLVPFLGETFTAENFFKSFDKDAVLAKLGVSWEEYNEKYRFGEDAEMRFLRYIKRLIRHS